ncbi:hypothetical protein [Lacticaseibacillus kribbianus]|uniref:hypothetical protein n=1 Tax=Lacticaseibacillus kribbianus TaxID=2926292 RepID=UPI001CD259CE|nr:hypothetical protein [Lacticaseibacillus kribbianus]
MKKRYGWLMLLAGVLLGGLLVLGGQRVVQSRTDAGFEVVSAPTKAKTVIYKSKDGEMSFPNKRRAWSVVARQRKDGAWTYALYELTPANQ